MLFFLYQGIKACGFGFEMVYVLQQRSPITTFARNPVPFLTEFREKYFRAGHAHAGVLLVMSLVYYVFLSQTTFSSGLKLLLCTAFGR